MSKADKKDDQLPVGRPTLYSAQLAAVFLQRVSNGRSVRSVCDDDDMPAISTIFLWLGDKNKHEFLEQYDRACARRAENIFEDTIEIADDGRNDYMERTDPENPGYDFNGEHVQRSKLRVETRKWFLSRMDPKKYGDKAQLDVSGKLTLEALIGESMQLIETKKIEEK